jgi:hypothetical protein
VVVSQQKLQGKEGTTRLVKTATTLILGFLNQLSSFISLLALQLNLFVCNTFWLNYYLH